LELIEMKSRNLCDLLEQKLDAFNNFLSATMVLKELLESKNDIEKIETFIDERQNCINMIDSIDCQINRIRKEITTLSYKTKERIKTLATIVDDTAAKTVHINKEFETMLQFHHDDIKNQLLKIRHSRDGVKGYVVRNYGGNQPRFLDVTS